MQTTLVRPMAKGLERCHRPIRVEDSDDTDTDHPVWQVPQGDQLVGARCGDQERG